MPSDPSMNDPGRIWRGQPTEIRSMTLEQIRSKTKELRARTRKDLLVGVLVPLIVVIVSLIGISWFDSLVLRALFVSAFLWSLAGIYFQNKGMWPAVAPENAGLKPGLESWRRELERRRHVSDGVLLWNFGPAAFTTATLAVCLSKAALEKGMLLNVAPFVTLFLLWMVSFFVLRMRDRQRLQREIEEMKAVENANG